MSFLPIVVVVPAPIKKRVDQLGAIATSIGTIFVSAGCDIDVKIEFHELAKPDQNVYDEQFRVYRQHFDGQAMVDLADTVVGRPRKKYVIFVCTGIVSAGATVGFSVNGQAVSCLALPGPTETFGSRDGKTWAHEVGHGLGLSHVDDIKNLMHGSLHDADGGKSGMLLAGGQAINMMRACENLTERGI